MRIETKFGMDEKVIYQGVVCTIQMVVAVVSTQPADVTYELYEDDSFEQHWSVPESELSAVTPSPAAADMEARARAKKAAEILADWHRKRFDYVWVHEDGSVTPSRYKEWNPRFKTVVASHSIESAAAMAAVIAHLEREEKAK